MNRFFFWRRNEETSGGRLDSAGPETVGLLTGDAEQDAQSLRILLESIAEVSTGLDLEEILGFGTIRINRSFAGPDTYDRLRRSARELPRRRSPRVFSAT